MGMMERIIRAALDVQVHQPQAQTQPAQAPQSYIPRDEGPPRRNDALTLDRAFNAISIDLHEYLRAMRDLVEEIRELRKRNEQVCGWLAYLQEDLRKALRPEAADVRELLILKRGASRTSDMGDAPSSVVLPGNGSVFGSTPIGGVL